MKIKILGAGVGGLCTAIALKKIGYDIDVYERHTERSHIGAGIVCWPNASFVLKELGILEDIATCSGKPLTMKRLSNKGDNLGVLNISKLNQTMQHPSLSILRKDLMEVLEQYLNKLGVKVNYECEIEQLIPQQSGSTNIHFKNGNVEKADIIIGADGRMSSVARKFVNGDNSPVYQGLINWIGIYESTDVIFKNIDISDYWGIGERFGIVPISSHKAYWAGAVAAEKIEDNNPEHYKTELLDLFANWPSPIAKIINETPLSKINKIFVHDHDPIKTWHRDNVLIIGDAAHAPLPTSGQGACQAIEDAWHLARLLKNFNGSTGELQSIFQDFTNIRFSKTTSITMGARQFASSLFNTDIKASKIRNINSQKTDYNLVVDGMASGWSSELPIHI